MISITKKYSDGKFSFLLSENGEEKGECFFSPFSSEISEIKEYSKLSPNEIKAVIKSVLNHLELSGKSSAFFISDGYEEILGELLFEKGTDGKYSVNLIGYFDKPCNCV